MVPKVKVRTRTRPGQRELDSQFKVAGQVGDAVGGGDDVSVADEGAAALELHVRAARDDVAEIGQPRILTDVRVLKHRCFYSITALRDCQMESGAAWAAL